MGATIKKTERQFKEGDYLQHRIDKSVIVVVISFPFAFVLSGNDHQDAVLQECGVYETNKEVSIDINNFQYFQDQLILSND